MMIFYSKNAHKLQDSVVRESVAASTAPEKRLTADVWGADVWGADFWSATSVALLPRGVVMVAAVVADPIAFSHLG